MERLRRQLRRAVLPGLLVIASCIELCDGVKMGGRTAGFVSAPKMGPSCQHWSRARERIMTMEGLDGERQLSSVEKRRIARAEAEKKAKMISKNQRMLEDFIGKRMGQGSTFYGERWSEMDDEQFEKLAPIRNDQLTEVKPLRDNPVLVIGASGQTGQWVTTDLLSKGFNVRAFVRKLERAEDLFGFDGANLDIFEGDVRNLESLKEAMRGAIAVIYCAGSREIWGGNSFKQVDAEGVENAVLAAQLSGCKSDDPRDQGFPPTVRKFVLLSSIGVTRPEELGLLNTLAGNPLGWKAKGEEAVRRSGLESYVIVRAAGLRDSNEGLRKEIEIGQGDQFGRSGISRLDVSTVLIQSLVQDVNDVTFEVRNGEGDVDMEGLSELFETSEPKRIMQYFLEEDQAEDEMWAQRFAALRPDPPV